MNFSITVDLSLKIVSILTNEEERTGQKENNFFSYLKARQKARRLVTRAFIGK